MAINHDAGGPWPRLLLFSLFDFQFQNIHSEKVLFLGSGRDGSVLYRGDLVYYLVHLRAVGSLSGVSKQDGVQ